MKNPGSVILFTILAALLVGCQNKATGTGTPQPDIPNPIAQFLPTNTPYPTYTPFPTLTPYPTYTPVPTFTPTPTPTPIRLCNPYWNDTETARVNLANSSAHAMRLLQNEIKRSTSVVVLPSGQNWAQFYLTFLSPQVAEAIVAQQAATELLTHKQSRDLLFDFDRRLESRNALPFLLTIRGKADSTINIYISTLEKLLTFTNQRQQEFRPLEQYSPVLASVINMASGGAEGFILAPRAMGDRCNPSLDVLNDYALTVRMSNIALWKSTTPVGAVPNILDSIQLPFSSPTSYRVPAAWSFNLSANKPLTDVMNTPAPKVGTTDIDAKTLADIAALATKVFKEFK